MKEGTSAVLFQSGLDETCRLILWSAIAICEMFNISWHMGENLMRDDSENHFEGPIIPFGAMVDIIRFLRKKSQGSTNLVRKSCQEYPSDVHRLREESGKETLWLRILRHARRLHAKELRKSNKGEISFSRSQMGQQNCQQGIMKSENQL